MANPVEPTPGQVRAVLLVLSAYPRQWAAENEGVAGLYFQDEDADAARQLAAAQIKAAVMIEDLATKGGQ